MKHKPQILVFLILGVLLLILAACGDTNGSPSVYSSGQRSFSAGTTPTSPLCDACAAATLSIAQTQVNTNTDLQAAATANIVVADAQATLNSVNATSDAVQAEQKDQANIVIAQITATAAVANANIQATLSASSLTQDAASTQNVIQQTQIVAQATTDAQATLSQQSQQTQVAVTQTIIADQFLSMIQAAVATSQSNQVLEMQRQAQEASSAVFIWTLCMPGFILMLGGLFLYGSWRWLGNRQTEQRFMKRSSERLHLPQVRVIDHRPNDSETYIDTHIAEREQFRLTKPDDQVGKWLDEVKREISNNEKKDEENESTSDQQESS